MQDSLTVAQELLKKAMERLIGLKAAEAMEWLKEVARLVAKEREVAGCPFKAGETLLLPFPAANRDPEKFDRPNDVIIDRENAHRHAAFGMGIHRCVGMHLARAEIRIALTALLARVPRFELAGDVTWARGPIRGPRQLPLRIL